MDLQRVVTVYDSRESIPRKLKVIIDLLKSFRVDEI